MKRKAIGGLSAVVFGLMLVGQSWAVPGKGATPAVPGGGNPNANSPNAATPAVPVGGNGNGNGRNESASSGQTTPSGVTPAQPGGGNPNSNSPNAATPASPANTGGQQTTVPATPPQTAGGNPGTPPVAVQPAPANTGNTPVAPQSPVTPAYTPVPLPVATGTGGSSAVQPVPVPPAPTYDRNAGTLFPNGTDLSAPVIPAFEPRPSPPRYDGPPPVMAPVVASPSLSFRGAILAANGSLLLLPLASSDEVLVLSAQTNAMITRVRVGPGPVAVVSGRGNMAWVACYNSAQVVGLDLAQMKSGVSIPVGTRPTALAVSPDGGRLYVANAGDATVSVVDLSRGVVAAVVPVGPSPQDVLVSPDGRRVYVVNSGDASVSVLDTASRQVITTIRGR